MKLGRELYEQIIDQAKNEAPGECCGMIATRDGEAVKVYPAVNAAASPPYAYEIDSSDLLRIQLAIDDADLDLGSIYHSHPRSEPYPSQTDINLAFYPDAVYIIVGLKGPEPVMRGYSIREGQVSEVELLIE